MSKCTTLIFLSLRDCLEVTDAGVRAVSSLPALKFLDLTCCCNVTAAGVQALRSSSTAPSLHIEWQHGGIPWGMPIEPLDLVEYSDSEEDSEEGEENVM